MKRSAEFFRRWSAALLVGFAATSAFSFDFVISNQTGLPIKWPAGPVPIRIMLGASQTLSDGSTFNSSAQAAADLWNTRLGSVQLQATTGSGTPSSNNGINELFFSNTVYGQAFDANVLAVTTGYSNPNANERTEADIVFNTANTWDSYRGPRNRDAIDIRRVALHELGHLLGLDHPDQAAPPQSVQAIMNSLIGNLDTLAEDDTNGGQRLYGPPGVPPNNNFASATSIELANGQLNLSGYNTNATKESGEPRHGDNNGGRSVWWRWQPPASGRVTIDTRGSYYDTTLAVYTGSTVGSLSSVAANDDVDPGRIQASTVSFDISGGTIYAIAVDGFYSDARRGADSGGIQLNLNYTRVSGAPTITSQPAPTSVAAGGSVTFSVIATGSDPLTYQWFFGGNAIAGATSASYTVSNVQAANAGSYSVRVSNAAGSVTSNSVSLTVQSTTPPPAPPAPPPSGGGGGGGGGAPSVWFVALLVVLGLDRFRRSRGMAGCHRPR